VIDKPALGSRPGLSTSGDLAPSAHCAGAFSFSPWPGKSANLSAQTTGAPDDDLTEDEARRIGVRASRSASGPPGSTRHEQRDAARRRRSLFVEGPAMALVGNGPAWWGGQNVFHAAVFRNRRRRETLNAWSGAPGSLWEGLILSCVEGPGGAGGPGHARHEGGADRRRPPRSRRCRGAAALNAHWSSFVSSSGLPSGPVMITHKPCSRRLLASSTASRHVFFRP
jgi:hypothetical protein